MNDIVVSAEEFSLICKLNNDESVALQRIIHDPEIMRHAYIIAGKAFQDDPESEFGIPESSVLAQAWFAAAFLSFDFSRKRFQQLGIPQIVWLDTMSDMAIWLRHEKRNHGIIGLGKIARSWTALLYRGEVLRFGRLECNRKSVFKYAPLAGANGDVLVAPGDNVINLHIPEDGPLNIKHCSASVRKMAEFFAERYPGYDWKGMTCNSWLCDTQLRDLLPENSNIIKFQALGIHYPVEEKADTVFRIFGTQDPFALQNTSSLQKKAAEFLKQGGVFREEGLFIPRKALEAVQFDLEKINIL